MLARDDIAAAQRRAAALIRASAVHITEAEAEKIEVADFGLSRLEHEGAQILTMVGTDRIGVKVIVLFPSQTVPEHRHPPMGHDPGKEETLRIVYGSARCYIPGEDTLHEGFVPHGKEEVYTVRHELILAPGDQITLQPGTKHWFQAGTGGVVLYSFSTVARDVLDEFTDPDIKRITEIQD